MESMIRLLELARRELGAEASYIRIGEEAHDDPAVLEHELQPGCVWVVRFAEVPADAELARRRMAELARAFDGTVGEAVSQVEELGLSGAPGHDEHALPRVLTALRNATSARVAMVIDRQSPVIWGSSEPDLGLHEQPAVAEMAEVLARPRVAKLADFLKTEPPRGPEDAAIARARKALRSAEDARVGGAATVVFAGQVLQRLQSIDGPDAVQPDAHGPGVAEKGIAGLYRVVLGFDEGFSPLRVEGVLRRALAVIERYIVELPPLDPTPKSARILPLRPR